MTSSKQSFRHVGIRASLLVFALCALSGSVQAANFLREQKIDYTKEEVKPDALEGYWLGQLGVLAVSHSGDEAKRGDIPLNILRHDDSLVRIAGCGLPAELSGEAETFEIPALINTNPGPDESRDLIAHWAKVHREKTITNS